MTGQELVLSRRCRHLDWRAMPGTPIEVCICCGFSLTFAASDRPPRDSYAKVQVQPKPGATFTVARASSLGVRNYQYKPLDLQYGRQIRVLVLKSGLWGEPLQCELEHVNLQQGPVYEALSYTWGDENGDDSICRSIQCGAHGQVLGISKNCEAALRHLRKGDRNRRLWVDAICIDQSNIKERNHQVGNMLLIYRTAIRVLVFLGKGRPIVDRLMDYMTNDSAGLLPRIMDFIQLFQSRWFHRIWVLQEVAVAKSVLVIYGTKQMDWADLMEHSNLFLRLMAARNFPLELPPVVSFGLLQTTTGGRRLQGKADLLSLMQVSRNCSCKDARDKVYAILGLLQDKSMLPLQPNYASSVTPDWVFLQAAAWHIVTTKSLDILSLVDGASLLKMPSWVPDWTRKSPSSLPAQLEISKDALYPCILSARHKLLELKGRLDYPPTCLLSVVARRCGFVWTSKTMFKTSTIVSDLTVSSNIHHHDRHWFTNPPQNSGYRHCPQRFQFWQRLHLLNYTFNDLRTTDGEPSAFDLEVPPAFGGPCHNCLRRNDFYHQEMGRQFPYERTIAEAIKPVCCCGPTHYDEEALNSFFATATQYGSHRRLFGTKYSLGIGPADLQDADELWIIEGARSPFILRPVKGHPDQYKLLGSCYVHGVDRSNDRCSSCSLEVNRGSEWGPVYQNPPPQRSLSKHNPFSLYTANQSRRTPRSSIEQPLQGKWRGLPKEVFARFFGECSSGIAAALPGPSHRIQIS